MFESQASSYTTQKNILGPAVVKAVSMCPALKLTRLWYVPTLDFSLR